MKYTPDEIEKIVADWSQCDQLDKMIKRIALYAAPDKDGWYDKYGVRVVNDIFEMHPYCWGSEPEHPDGADEDDENCPCPLCNETLPNFWHKPSGLKVWWYKYIGRGRVVEMNGYPRARLEHYTYKRLGHGAGHDPEQLGAIQSDCLKAVRGS